MIQDTGMAPKKKLKDRITSSREVTQRCQAKLHIRNLGLQLRVYITPKLA